MNEKRKYLDINQLGLIKYVKLTIKNLKDNFKINLGEKNGKLLQ
jgi:hypothetical protein